MLRCVGNTFKLGYLREINVISEMLWQIKSTCDIVNHFVVAVHTFLVREENLAVKVVILRLCKNTNSVHIRQRFKAEFTAKSRHTTTIIVHWLQAVPYAPQMGITHIIGINADIMRFSDRRAGGVRSKRVDFANFTLENFVEKLFGPRNILRHIYPCHMHILNLIITAPQSKRRM